jgi:hypothetical protein
MGEVLGIGLSHYPPLSLRDEDMASILRRFALQDPAVPDEAKDPSNWPELMRREWGHDEGRASAATHRAELLDAFRKLRRLLDEFAPDAIVIWGDDQYENFKEDIVPPYAVLALPDMELRPWADAGDSADVRGRPNAWDEPPETTLSVRGRPDIAKELVTGLLDRKIDVSYAYRTLHHPGLPHAFLNAVLYLDYDRMGFDHPVIPFSINCYGRRVIADKGFVSNLGDDLDPDPPSPRPDRLMEVGAATAEVLASNDWRVALMASSSWSHAFLCDKHLRLRPDTPSDRKLYDAMVAADYDVWRSCQLDDIEDAGQHELLNWFPLLGAMEALGHRVSWSCFVETDVFNSNKVFATFAAEGG